MQLAAKRVSTDVSGDYYQAVFSSGDQDIEPVGPCVQPAPYVLIQRQFEFDDDDTCYIESHDEKCTGHFKLKLAEFSASRLGFEIGTRDKKFVEVSFALSATEFEEVRQIVEVIFGVREPEGDSDFVDDTR